MNDQDLFDLLRDRHEGGAEMLDRLKTAGLADVLRDQYGRGKTFVADNKLALGIAAAGAGLGTVASYLSARRSKKDGKSMEERAAERLARATATSSNEASYSRKLTDLTARTTKDLAKLRADHPVASAHFGTTIGAGLAWKAGKRIQDFHKAYKAEMAKKSSVTSSPLRALPKPTMPKFNPNPAMPKMPGAPTLPKVAEAEEWGRALAKEAALKDIAARAGAALTRAGQGAGRMIGDVSRAAGQAAAPHLNKVGPAVGAAVRRVTGTPAAPLGKAVGGIAPKNLAIGGAVAGAAVGGLRHMMKPKDPRTGQRQGSLIGSMATGGALGGVGGLAAPAFLRTVQNNRHISDFMQGRLGTRPATMRPQQGSFNFGGPNPATAQIVPS